MIGPKIADLVGVIDLILFGPKKLPELGKAVDLTLK